MFVATGRAAPDDGEMVTVELDDVAVAVAATGGRLYAFQDLCTHAQCSLSDGDLEGSTVVCPCHLGEFDIATGAVVSGPPPASLRTWRVRAVDGLIELGP